MSVHVKIGAAWRPPTGIVAGATGWTIVTATANGDDGNVPANTIDGDPATRWSHNADPSLLTLDLGQSREIGAVRLHQYNGDNGNPANFDLETSPDNTAWTRRFHGRSTGTTDGFEEYRFPAVTARYVRYVGFGRDSSPWNSINRVEVLADLGAGAPAPATLDVTPGDGQVALDASPTAPSATVDTWQWFGGDSVATMTSLGAASATSSLTDTGLTNGTQRYYKVVATNVDGSTDSAITTATPAAAGTPDPEVNHGTALTMSDVSYSGTLSATEGRYTTQQNGEVIEGRSFRTTGGGSHALTIAHSGVIVRNCKIATSGSEGMIKVDSGITGTRPIIEHCEIDGEGALYSSPSSSGNDGIQLFSPALVRRNYIHGVRQGIQMWGDGTGNTDVVENWIDDIVRPAPGNSTTGISYRGTNATSAVANVARNRVEADAGACISGSARTGPVRGWLTEDNLMIGPANRTVEGTGLKAGYEPNGDYLLNENIKHRGNRWDGTFSWGNITHLYAEPDAHPDNEWSDNRWVDGTIINP